MLLNKSSLKNRLSKTFNHLKKEFINLILSLKLENRDKILNSLKQCQCFK